jgi:hypothetical protein
MRGVRLSLGKAAVPKRPFSRENIITFMDAVRTGLLLDWRAALPLALCFQQLLRGAECFELKGSNVVRQPTFFLVEVKSAKNLPEGFSFQVPIDPARSHCVGQSIVKMGVKLGEEMSYFACWVGTVKGVLKSTATTKVANLTMRAACKRLIEAVGLDPSLYASHSCKRGGVLAAMEAGLSQVQIQDLGRCMVKLFYSGEVYLQGYQRTEGIVRRHQDLVREGTRHPPWAVRPQVTTSVWGSMESVASFFFYCSKIPVFPVEEYSLVPLAPTTMAVLVLCL